MTPEEFKKKAQEIYDTNKGHAGEEGHWEMDCLIRECLESLGYYGERKGGDGNG